MPFYTTVSRIFRCPLINEEIVITGKYKSTDNPENPYEVSFCYATCPIAENSSLPTYEQNDKYKYYRCTKNDCEYRHVFPKHTNLK